MVSSVSLLGQSMAANIETQKEAWTAIYATLCKLMVVGKPNTQKGDKVRQPTP